MTQTDCIQHEDQATEPACVKPVFLPACDKPVLPDEPARRPESRLVTSRFCRTNRVDVFRERFQRVVLAGDPGPAAMQWRLSLFERGLKITDELEQRGAGIAGQRALDVGSAYGGDLAALCARGAVCVGTDLFDHDYERLKDSIGPDEPLEFVLSDCTATWPFRDNSFDVILSMSVIEIVDDLESFFSELLRVLRPDGIALVDTGTVLRMARRDPLYRLPVISLMPTPLRRFVAERVFRRQYRFHVSNHTFYSARKFKRYMAASEFEVLPCKFADSPVMSRALRWPGSRIWRFLIRHLAYDFVLIRRLR